MIHTWTTSGKFTFGGDDPAEINLQDIATSLARQIRFNGHGRFAWSVAQHSILVSTIIRILLPEGDMWTTEGRCKRLAGLLHDVGEAYIGDITRPVRRLIGESACAWLNDAERHIRNRVYRTLNLDLRCIDCPEIQRADDLALAIELRVLFPHVPLLMPASDVERIQGLIIPLIPMDSARDGESWLALVQDYVSMINTASDK